MNNTVKNQKITEKMIYDIVKENSLRDFLSNNYISKIDQIYEIKHYQKKGYEYFLEGTDVDYFAEWTKKGLFFYAKAIGADVKIFNEIWEEKGCDFQMLFPRFELEYIRTEENTELKIKAWDIEEKIDQYKGEENNE
jgi:hypothetical protein